MEPTACKCMYHIGRLVYYLTKHNVHIHVALQLTDSKNRLNKSNKKFYSSTVALTSFSASCHCPWRRGPVGRPSRHCSAGTVATPYAPSPHTRTAAPQ